jgi:hypothetical protein
VVQVSVSPTLTLALGDKVAEAVTKAASDAANAYFATLKGPLTQLQKDTAVEKGVAAGETKAAEMGKPLDAKTKSDLTTEVKKGVDNAK